MTTRKEMSAFLRDIATIGEIDALGERLLIAKLLESNMSYRDVSMKTGASLDLVTRVAHWLAHGQGGYRTALSRLKK